MDRWIATAWKAFWVGLGASAVLISQAVLAPGPVPVSQPAPAALPLPPAAQPAAFAPSSNAAVMSRMQVQAGRCATVANVTRCS